MFFEFEVVRRARTRESGPWHAAAIPDQPQAEPEVKDRKDRGGASDQDGETGQKTSDG
jgi:hypothetical protein